jgi:hypothetical protein
LSGLTNLWYVLYLGGNEITDISALSGLVNLRYLHLEGNQISEISSLAGFTNLTRLRLTYNPLNTAAYCAYLPLIEANNLGASISYDEPNPNPMTEDCSTHFADLAVFVSHWLEIGCDVPNNWCGGADLDHIDDVNFKDFAEFAKYWLE